MTFEEFQDGRPGGHIGPEWNNFSNFVSLCHCASSHQVSAQSDRVWEEMSFDEFQDGHPGSHLGYRNGTILVILNLHVATMPPTKYQLNPRRYRKCES